MRQQQVQRTRLRDWLLYVAISLLIFAAIAAFAVYQARTGGSPELPLKWLMFAGMTAIIFGYAIRGYRRWWRQRKFWLLLAAFFIAHIAVGTLALTRVDKVPLLLFVPLAVVENTVLAVYLGFFMRV